MKINISRQNLYLLAIALTLFIAILLFAFLVLIPEGKSYREKRLVIKKEEQELKGFQAVYDETYEILKNLKSDHRAVITAFDNRFDSERFIKQNESFFNSLTLAKISSGSEEAPFMVYEVNTTSHISSPKSFYGFLEHLNKSDWIVSVDFPIHFKREENLIKSTFSMKVYGIKADSNTTQQ